jgi:hypothetical protein
MSRNRSRKKHKGFLARHSLSIVASCVLVLWIVLYRHSDPGNHWGSFFGNAIADWTGMVVMVFATKHLYEKGSAESKTPPKEMLPRTLETLREHSLTVFLVMTGLIWVALYARMDSEGKWGQVIGNIVSEWTQILGLVLMTKKLIESRSEESKK